MSSGQRLSFEASKRGESPLRRNIREPRYLMPGRTLRYPAASREPESSSRLLSSQTDRRCHFSTRWAQAG